MFHGFGTSSITDYIQYRTGSKYIAETSVGALHPLSLSFALNGGRPTTGSVINPIYSLSSTLNIGANYQETLATKTSDAEIAEIVIFNRALSVDTATSIRNELSARWNIPLEPWQLGSKLKLWLNEKEQTVSSGLITTWGDQSPGGLVDFTQSVAANQPIDGRFVNGWPSPHFSASLVSRMTSAKRIVEVATASSSCVLAVVDIAAIPTAIAASNWYLADGVIGDSGGYWGISLGTIGGNPVAAIGSASPGSIATASISTGLHLIQGRLLSGNLSIRVDNGAEYTTSSIGYTNVLGKLVIGRGYTGGGGSFTGSIAELIAIDPPPTSAELASVRSYLATKHGVTV